MVSAAPVARRPYRRPDGAGRMAPLQVAAAYRMEFGTEALRHARMPEFVLPALLFPSMSYALFTGLLGHVPETDGDLLLLADHASFAAIAPGLFAFGIAVARERENGFLLWKRALPMPDHAYFGAKLSVCMLMTVLSVLLLLLVARLTGHAVPGPAPAVLLLVVVALGSLPYCALGAVIGGVASGRNATGLVMLLLVPLAFLSGLLVPAQALPPALRAIAMATPGYDLSEFALVSMTAAFSAALVPGAYLLYFTLLFATLARWRLRAFSQGAG
jgi:ABC-2 type transport system permease protein